jgi:hypothetical protein
MTQIAQIGSGSTPKITIKHNLGSDVYENLDNLIELYFYILDASEQVIARYSKSGTEINGNTYIALLKEDEYTYKALLTSTILKALSTQELYGEVYFKRTDTDFTDNQGKADVRFKLLKLNKTVIGTELG